MNRSHKSGEKILISYFLLVGLSFCGYWATRLSGSYLADNTGGNLAVWHVIAEILAGVLALIAAFLMLSRYLLGYRLALFTSGILLCTGLNSIGWGVLHDPGILVLYLIAIIGSIYGFFYLLGREEL